MLVFEVDVVVDVPVSVPDVALVPDVIAGASVVGAAVEPVSPPVIPADSLSSDSGRSVQPASRAENSAPRRRA